MDNKNKQRVSVYIDKKLVDKMDMAVKISDCNSRNEFAVSAIEKYVAQVMLDCEQEEFTETLASEIAQANDTAMKKVSSGLFRYAVYVDMMVQMLAENMNYSDSDLKELHRKAYNNVRRTKGRVSLDNMLLHAAIDETDEEI